MCICEDTSSGWWFGTWLLWLSIYWEFHHPNWLTRTHIFQRGGSTTNRSSSETQWIWRFRSEIWSVDPFRGITTWNGARFHRKLWESSIDDQPGCRGIPAPHCCRKKSQESEVDNPCICHIQPGGYIPHIAGLQYGYYMWLPNYQLHIQVIPDCSRGQLITENILLVTSHRNMLCLKMFETNNMIL